MGIVVWAQPDRDPGHTSADMKVFDWIVGELISHRHPSGWRQNVLHILVIVVSAQLNKVKLHQRVVIGHL